MFTTEDGVDIMKGDKVYFTCEKYSYNVVNIFDPEHDCALYSCALNRTYKTFSTKEAAEEYIILNKPCLSINDILKFCGSTQSDIIKTVSLEGLKITVKSKL